MRNTNIVAEYDYYTLDQAREIIYAEMQRDRDKIISLSKHRRKQKIENIKFTLGISVVIIGFPLLMCLHWLVIGY